MQPGAQLENREGGVNETATHERRTAPPFPLFLKLAARLCLVVGAGREGESKIAGLLAADASVRVVAPEATAAVQAWAREGRLQWMARAFEETDLDGAFLVVVASSRRELNKHVYQEARRRRVLCNVVDDPPHCDFYYPSVVRRGALQIAISTDGKSPALAQRLRRELEEQFEPEYQAWIDRLGQERARLFQQPMDPELRRRRLHELASRESFDEFARSHSADPKRGEDREGAMGLRRSHER
jgi:precorrin-2 dehydrogenase/sirohydrochlorin ferrochelatase